MEFESRGARPIYEFIIQTENDTTYYVGCDAMSGVLQDVDILVDADDSRFSGKAKVSADQAGQAALALYPGEIEEVKSFLTNTGHAAYEIDVEVGGEAGGEFNVWVDAASGEVYRVDVEYWEIGAQ